MTLQDSASSPPASLVDVDLTSRYRVGGGPIIITGVQAIGRLLAEQHAADAAAGLRTASFVSGYQGSPLGTLDMALAGSRDLVETAGLRLVPGLNEELAATEVWGSQLEVPDHPRNVDGVIGVWYGKSPGVDRAGDALRHANMCGAHPHGGVLVLAGDDPGCKSSTLPCVSERALATIGMPVLYPADAADIVRLGRYGVALSRASGMWVGMKITTDVADGLYSVDASVADVEVSVPRLDWDGSPWAYRQYPMLTPPASLRAEEQLHGPRTAMVQAFLAANPINTVTVDTSDAWLGIIAGGKAFADLRQALSDLGLADPDSDTALRRAGIRLLRLGMIHPLERAQLGAFAAGLDTLLVVEEKTPFIETSVRDVLYGMAAAPTVIGAEDAQGRPLVSVTGELTAQTLNAPLRRVLRNRVDLAPQRREPPALDLLPLARTPYFCAGCPHSRSTVVPDGAVAGGGIGCHGMVTFAGRPESEVVSITQMGGEGAQWIGQAPFTTARHMFQNIGDGTYSHSGQLAVQACVAAGVSITFKLLYNRAVAMTGGQDPVAGLDVPELATKLLAEGVRKVIVCADEPQGYRKLAKLPRGVVLWHRDRFDEAQRVLAEVEGVSVLIYDQRCAAEARRLRKRGTLPIRRTRVVINEAVCEGCGDCGHKSNCLAVLPVDTEFGRKTRIDQSSCNTDYSCLDGDCPSFVTVELPPGQWSPAPNVTARREPPKVAEPLRFPLVGTADVFLAGIGGTGIVTVNQVLAVAGVSEGLVVHGLDQTGLSQKAGPVTSHLRIAPSDASLEPANRVRTRAANCYLAFDTLVGADGKNLTYASQEHTIAIASTSAVPTGAQVRDPLIAAPDPEILVSRIARNCRGLVTLDAAGAALALFGDTMPANFLLVGAAYQAGALPVSAAAIESAIALNGVAVKNNVAAFRWGRVAVADPQTFAAATRSERPVATSAATAPGGIDLGELAGETRRLAAVRVADLLGFQGRRTAERYVADVRTVWRAERAVGGQTTFSEAVARGLHKLVAYKDEYEVARLLTDPAFEARLRTEVPGGTKLHYRLHPPFLRAMGRKKKVAFGPWLRPVLRILAKGRAVRNTPLDPFGYARVRRLERELRDSYRAMVLRLAGSLSDASYGTAVSAAEAVDLIRGYEDVKLANVERYRARLVELGVSS
jgi:indolepyruvate ferredoxin oxidoreductase